MKKTLIVFAVLAVLLTTVGIGIASAQGETGRGVLHPYIVEAFAAKLELDVDEVNAAIDSGQTLYEIALANGVAAEDFPALMTEVRQTAIAAALEDGVITQEQADWMLSHMQGAGRGGSGRGGMMDGTGTGTCGGTGVPVGSGMHHGGRWQNQNP